MKATRKFFEPIKLSSSHNRDSSSALWWRRSATRLRIRSHRLKEHEITSWHLRSASFWTPSGVSRSDTWKFSTSISEAPNLARTHTFSNMSNWTCLSVISKRVRRNLSRSFDRSRCSSSSTLPDEEEETVVGHRAMKRGEVGSNPRLFGSGPLGSRRTLTGVFIVLR